MEDVENAPEPALTEFRVLPLNIETTGRSEIAIRADTWGVSDTGDLYFYVGNSFPRQVACFARGTWLTVIER
jgi:hypothetical protein